MPSVLPQLLTNLPAFKPAIAKHMLLILPFPEMGALTYMPSINVIKDFRMT